MVDKQRRHDADALEELGRGHFKRLDQVSLHICLLFSSRDFINKADHPVLSYLFDRHTRFLKRNFLIKNAISQKNELIKRIESEIISLFYVSYPLAQHVWYPRASTCIISQLRIFPSRLFNQGPHLLQQPSFDFVLQLHYF